MKVETTEEKITHAKVCRHWNIAENRCDCYSFHTNRKFGPVGADCEMCPTRKEQHLADVKSGDEECGRCEVCRESAEVGYELSHGI